MPAMTNSPFSGSTHPDAICQAAAMYGTPLYLYDESILLEKCRQVLAMPNAFGLQVRYAMKANSNRALLQLITAQGIGIDASSLNEVRRAILAGIALERILLTTQEVPEGEDRAGLETLLLRGMRYNVCSLRQLSLIASFASIHRLPLSLRIHPGHGSGESATRNTGDKFSCFGVHLSDVPQALEMARAQGILFDQVHTHIGSGGDPAAWRENIDRELGFVARYFPQARTVSFGGGFREARMPDEIPADIHALGEYARQRMEEFHRSTGRKLATEVEPGTYLVARAGFLVARVIDIKRTGGDGFEFLVLDGGMETNARPLLYGSRHPFYVVSQSGELLSSEFNLDEASTQPLVPVGRCCESGDSLSLDARGHIIPRRMALPQVGDFLVTGGCGAYCASMSPFNYNSHVQAPEVLLRADGELVCIRKRQTLEQVVENEMMQ
jgi:diaminopimelate decarboxylase